MSVLTILIIVLATIGVIGITYYFIRRSHATSARDNRKKFLASAQEAAGFQKRATALTRGLGRSGTVLILPTSKKLTASVSAQSELIFCISGKSEVRIKLSDGMEERIFLSPGAFMSLAGGTSLYITNKQPETLKLLSVR